MTIESLRKELAYSADTDGAIKRIDAAVTWLGKGCLVAVIDGDLDIANDMALGLKSLKSAMEFLEGTRYGIPGNPEGESLLASAYRTWYFKRKSDLGRRL